MGAGLSKFVTVNLGDIETANFNEGDEVSLESLIAKRILNPSGREERLRLKVPPSPNL
jgi:large subunit ribosomal protein L15